jgi:hypothetical protein
MVSRRWTSINSLDGEEKTPPRGFMSHPKETARLIEEVAASSPGNQ